MLVVEARQIVSLQACLEVAHEILVPFANSQDDVRDGACERAVGAWDDGQPLVGLGGCGREARVDDDDVRGVHDLAPMVHDGRLLPVRADGVGRPHKEILSVLHVVVTIGVHAVDGPRCSLLSFGADGCMAVIVRRAHEGGEIVIDCVAHFRRTTFDKHEPLGLLRIVKFEKLLGDGIEGFVPRDGDETWIDPTAFLRVGSLHRRLDPVGIIHLLKRKRCLGAALAVGGSAVLVAVDANGASIFHVDLDGAEARAALAG